MKNRVRLVPIVLFAIGCSRTDRGDEKEKPRVEEKPRTEAKPEPRTDVGFGTLIRDEATYEGRFIQTTAAVVSNLEKNGKTIVRLAEPGAPPDSANMFCVLADPPASLPAMGASILIRGHKRGVAFSPCWIVLDAGR